MTPAPHHHARLRPWATATLTTGAALLLAAYLLVVTPWGQRLDVAALGSMRLSWPDSDWVNALLTLVTPGLVLIVALTGICVGLVRRRLDLTAGALVTLAGANITTRLLKVYLLPRPDLGLPSGVVGPENSLPSGHTTATMSFVLAAMLVVPGVGRRAVAGIGAGWVAFVGYAMVAVGGHRPSDIAAGIGVGLVWGALGVVVASVVRSRADRLPITVAEWVLPEHVPPGAAGPVLAATLLGAALSELAVVAAGVVVRPSLHQTVAAWVVAVVIAVLAALAVTWLACGVATVADRV